VENGGDGVLTLDERERHHVFGGFYPNPNLFSYAHYMNHQRYLSQEKQWRQEEARQRHVITAAAAAAANALAHGQSQSSSSISRDGTNTRTRKRTDDIIPSSRPRKLRKGVACASQLPKIPRSTSEGLTPGKRRMLLGAGRVNVDST
jgi:hypothetical protein